MARIFLINVGANLSHRSKARCPLFRDAMGEFEFVAYPDPGCHQGYPARLFPYVKPAWRQHAHLDPDWTNLTYGDHGSNGRAGALLTAVPDDIFLFWSMLWHVPDRSSEVFHARDKGWYLIGALRVQCFLKSGESVAVLPADQQARVLPNAHMNGAKVMPSDRVFLGQPNASAIFQHAVDLEVYRDGGLLQQTVTDKHGRTIAWETSPKWSSVTRSCRAILDAADPRAKLLRDRIRKLNPTFDLLVGLP